jgi:very-short-patch-repair endonuclease
MGAKRDHSLWERAVERAVRQHGRIARRQLLALGFSDKAIKHGIASGRLFRTEFRGVYALGRPEFTKYARWMGAVLSRGDGTALSDDPAGALWRIWKPRDTGIHLTVPAGGRRHKTRGVTVHRRSLRPSDVTRERGIPVTTPLRTIVDLAATSDRREAERLVNAADARNVLRADTLAEELKRMKGQPGVPLLEEILAPSTFVLTDSELERMFLPLVRRAGLPKPQSQRRLGPHRVDFHWPELDLVVEVDSLRYHRTTIQQAEDRARDHIHFLAERQYLRFTHHQIAHDPDYVVAVLTSVRLRAA